MNVDEEWYPMVLVGRTGNEVPREVIDAKSLITKEVEADSIISQPEDSDSADAP